MKTYIFSKESKIRRTYGGENVTCTIYRMKRNIPVYVGQCFYCTSSCKGDESEVFTHLQDIGELPKNHEFPDIHLTARYRDGYYSHCMKEYVSIYLV